MKNSETQMHCLVKHNERTILRSRDTSVLLEGSTDRDDNKRGRDFEIEYDDTEGGLCIPFEKRCNVNRCMTLQEMAVFLNLDPWGVRWRAFFETMAKTGLRPVEVCKLTPHMVISSPTDFVSIDGVKLQRWVGLIYPVGKPKPTGMPKRGELPKKATRKWNRKDERDRHIPPGALLALQTYWFREGCKPGTLFPKAYSQYGKAFSLRRKRMIELGFERFTKCSDDYFPAGWAAKKPTNAYDIGPYSFRRTFVTADYWLVSTRNGVPNIIATRKRMAHSNYQDTAIYTHEPNEIGLSDTDIGRGWEHFNQQLASYGQTRLNQFMSWRDNS